MNIGRNIKLIRISKSISQKKLAEMLSITPTYLSLIENEAKKPSLTLIERLAAALNIPLTMLFSELSFE